MEGSGRRLVTVLSLHLPGGTEENDEKPSLGCPAFLPRFVLERLCSISGALPLHLLRLFFNDVDPALGHLHRVEVGPVAGASDVHDAYIFTSTLNLEARVLLKHQHY